MYFWLTDPELFLYAKGTGPDDVHLWRCKKPASSSSSSSLAVPMKSDDFEYVSNVKNHLELIGYMFEWDETDYKRLVKYVYEKRLLVNGQGFVIAELHKVDKDGNKMIDDANEEVPIYIRSLDVLPLKPYIPNVRELPIPLRTVKYLGDAFGRAALMEEDSKVTKLTARVDNIEAENTRLEAKNNTLDTNVRKLTAGLATTTNNVADLESKNKTLEVHVTNLTADLATQKNALAALQRELNRVLENITNPKILWMNDLTNNSTDWVGIKGLGRWTANHDNMTFLGQPGFFIGDDSSTNVRARYWYKVKLQDSEIIQKAVCVEDLAPYKDKARFSRHEWWSCIVRGNIYVCKRL